MRIVRSRLLKLIAVCLGHCLVLNPFFVAGVLVLCHPSLLHHHHAK